MLIRKIRGLAVTFLQIERVGNAFEHFEQCAFDAMLGAGRRVAISAYDHGNIALGQCRNHIDLHTDETGLWFQASINCEGENFNLIRSIASGMDRASIGGVEIIQADCGEHNGRPHCAVRQAEFSEITVCSDPAYRNTRIWFADCADELPPVLQDWDRRWTAGRNAFRHRAQQTAPAKRLAASAPIIRDKTYRDVYADAVAWVSNSGAPLIVGHADFSRSKRDGRR